jgi:hypothetical protein
MISMSARFSQPQRKVRWEVVNFNDDADTKGRILAKGFREGIERWMRYMNKNNLSKYVPRYLLAGSWRLSESGQEGTELKAYHGWSVWARGKWRI